MEVLECVSVLSDIPCGFGTGVRLARREDGKKLSGRLSNVMEPATKFFGG